MKQHTLSTICAAIVLSVVVLVYASASVSGSDTWRSNLYPEDWTPCYQDEYGRFIQDFSFAGYHAGTRPLPTDTLHPVVDVTQTPYRADNTGQQDATAAIQQALNDVGQGGGGTVYLPPGQYKLKIDGSKNFALGISHSNVRLVGAGPDETFLHFETTEMRGKEIIRVFGENDWRNAVGSPQRISEALVYPTQIIPLDGPPQFEVGDWVVLRHDTTDDWVLEHYMDDLWWSGAIPGATMYRQIIAVDHVKNTITIDAPTRYYLLPRDNARVYKVHPHIEEVGISDLAIGMVEHPGSGWGETDYQHPGTGGYAVHGAHAIRFRHVVNSWVRNVKSFKPEQNDWAHLISNGIVLWHTRFVTIDSVELHNPQYRGSGGNGYHFTLIGNDSLIINSKAYYGRHNYDFKQAYANGNVITHSFATSPDSRNSDFHMHLSPSNLVDYMFLDRERFDAGWHGEFGTAPHGLTTTQSVLWNIHGERYKPNLKELVYTEQYGWGYVIGTRGPAHDVRIASNIRTIVENGQLKEFVIINPRTLPEDYVEGVGQGDTLRPQSLYLDQLERRLNRNDVIHCPELDFRPPAPRISIHYPRSGETITSCFRLGIDVKSPVPDARIEEIIVTLNDEEIFKGNTIPKSFGSDLDHLPDGFYTLAVTASSNNGLTSWEKVSFNLALKESQQARSFPGCGARSVQNG